MKYYHNNTKSGFTLMEMVVSLGIFSSIMLMSIGALVSVQNAQIRSSDEQIVQDNIRFALELMTKEIRQGNRYEGERPACISGCRQLTFVRRSDGSRVGYCASGGALLRFNVTGGQSCSLGSAVVLTAEEAIVDGALFYILGQDQSPADGQARVTIVMRVRAQSQSQKTETAMDLQTTVVQRLREG